MKSSLIRPALALALAAGLAGCGGSDKAEFVVKGTITGIVYPGAVLTTNGMEIAIAPPATPRATVSFSFPNTLEYGDVYDVAFKSFPANQKCDTPQGSFDNRRDTAGRLAEINITFACAVDIYTIGGTVSGLTADGLVLANGSTGGTFSIAKPAAGVTTPISYVFAGAVEYDQTYGVTVLTQPTGQVCTVANATGTMKAANVTNINVTCEAARS
ncbi:hypothetical protein SOM61_09570 [Massilia sp. CFBP9012]|uniref:hypothetical protein n=1 Tax=Massilia sp. CFBP9012 TaxID=3096531 RepID=UPI002A6B8190|nr:hypothetical protein [Massilia sp. CFBP9012]MDY0975213.1 hypothetical protein [Massilia sp. CFBP9012]